MNVKPVSPKTHGIVDYALVASLLVLPSVFGFNKKVKQLYMAEGLLLLGYVALTDHPTGIWPVIPFTTHGKIDPFNVAQFALQSCLKPFRKDKKAMAFNLVFTALSAVTVSLTDWHGPTKKNSND